MSTQTSTLKTQKYRYGFHDTKTPVYQIKPGLSKRVVEEISHIKNEPQWMREFRLRALEIFEAKSMPTWGGDLSAINFDNIIYYSTSADKQSRTWEDVPADIKKTFDRLGVPEAERNTFAGVGAQYDSNVVYHNVRADLEKQGVIFCDTDTAVQKYPDLVKKYFGTVVPIGDNKFAALNTACWSGGSFIYVPKGVKVSMPLQAYFRINSKNFGQFERTLIIADEGSDLHYIEGCTAPVYSTDSLHAAVVEIIAHKNAHVRYTTIQNWSSNVYNLVTKRARAEESAFVEWIDGNLGCLTGDTPIFTTKGPVAMEKVKKGDRVYALNASTFMPETHPVTAKKMTGRKQTFLLTTENFREIKATKNHPFLVLEGLPYGAGQFVCWKALGELCAGNRVAINYGLPDSGKPYRIAYAYRKKARGWFKHIPTIPSQSNEDLMWLLGLYLGDGCIEKSKKGDPRRVNFATPPRDRARKRLEETLMRVFAIQWTAHRITVRIASSMVADFILKLGFDGTARSKRIPSWIHTLPFSQRMAFIEGYFDADGYLRKNLRKDGKQFGQIVFASANKNLLKDLKLLLMGCGLNPLKISTYGKERRLYRGRLKLYTAHYLTLNIRDALSAIKEKKPPPTGIHFVRIRSIQKSKVEPVYDIEVQSAHNFIANGIIVHNSKLTMKYPSVFLHGRGARADVLSVALAGPGQHQDAGAKVVHLAPDTISSIVSKSVSFGGGRTAYRGLAKVVRGAVRSRIKTQCDALILDPESRSDTYPTMAIEEENVRVEHEATVSRIGEKELFYLQARGLTPVEATSMVVAGFFEPLAKVLPIDYAIELNRLIEMEMEGSVG